MGQFRVAAMVLTHNMDSDEERPKNQKLPKPKKAGVMTMTPIGQLTGQHGNRITDMMEITPKVIGTIGLILLPLRN